MPAWPIRTTARVLTARGAQLLRERALAESTPEAERHELEVQLAQATIVEPPADRAIVALGAMVSVRGIARANRSFELVPEEEVDVECGRIGAASPLGSALLGKRAGDVVIWERPVGNKALTILAVDYQTPRAAPTG